MNRRGFLLGLTSVLAAPAIVHAGNLMPVRAFDPYYTRYLVAYHIGTDELLLRVDRTLFPLPTPNPRYAEIVSPEFAHRFLPRKMIDSLLKPTGVQQLHVDTVITSFEALKSRELWGSPGFIVNYRA